jgi:hypothetical protein
MSLDYPQKMLDMCGISHSELEKRIRLLEKHLGEPFIESLFKRYGGLSVALINQICERSVLVESLSTAPGFAVIRKRIVNPKNNASSLDEPHGEWFQLIVGYLLRSVNEQPLFEQKVDGNPKDILLRQGDVHIECKSFRGSEALNKALNELIRLGKTPSLDSDKRDGFTVGYEVITSIPGWPPNPSFSVNESRRFFQRVIEEKLPKLLVGKCNIIAFNVDLFAGDMESFRETLRNLLHDYRQASGFLVVQTYHKLPGDPFKLLGSAYAIELITDQQAAIPVPADLLQALTPQVIRIALRL